MKKILIIEDDFYIRSLYRQSFLNANYEVDEAADGDEALNLFKTRNYDIILLDIMLPRVNGLDVLRIIRSIASPKSKTSVFVMTNLGSGNETNEAMKIGANKCILKANYEPHQLVKEVDDYLLSKNTANASSQTTVPQSSS
ncbi:hypothetical protein A2865_03375 [Candidatus Woesebacteria bacterium RIFCSPHIGHO2_01_FULL_39_17]|uniref:Response regulator receiver protein n=3 Tax=Candidatus Woeseibacteriota TaxID=1752722 RepID=A0A0G0NAQ5_9BACT|nr:MAG: Sensor protein [Microgenomates group bacterium GW2011_GWC1_38_12]KKQ93805.1 MAG: Response regulator receiver protein [Candidatus Woesebacteria bacterium GW2011_GWB1_39_10b]KKR13224.1 MAG: Response regulator receiver protein [Candidatus Woesebacteria bacterium GW2011_GWA1_39_21b]OGM23575.1 MAG: hypothetical protein A2865_03375 [Candidatus Woesebacteria bacterium RIFCSPHIGHO2_01_FULL_39_17]OGM63386.1 MAG: hypothetical protein A3A52_04505 [Candidatus Woesebacteria bacterium RIFCSPLOWO2_01_